MNIFRTALMTLTIALAGASTAALAALETRVATAPDGSEIAYVEGGSGPLTLIFVHGWTCDHTYWEEQLSTFAEDYHVIALDLAGHGASSLGRDYYSMQSFGADVAAVAPDDGSVVLIGHSMGGPVILQAALQLGDRVSGLVAVDTLNNVGPPMTDEEAVAARVAPLQADYAGTAEQFITAMFVEDSDPELKQRIVDDMLATDRTVGIDAIKGMLRSDVGAALQAVDAPLVIINSDYQPTNLPAVQEHHPETRLELMGGVGHFVMMEDPETFNTLLQEAVSSFEQ